jgi:uncharacterized membrane protein YkvA (DUF1232 family)
MALRSTLRVGLTAASFWPFLPVAARAPLYGRLVLELLRDPRVPWSRKAIIGLAAAYVASPVDIIPDAIPLVSRIDDVAVAIIALDLFLDGVPRDVMIERMYALGIDGRELERDLESVRRFLPEPIRQTARRLPEVIEVGAAIIRRELVARGVLAPGEGMEAHLE